MLPGPGLRDVVGLACLIVLQSELGIGEHHWRHAEGDPTGPRPGRSQAPESSDCASLLQTHVEVQSLSDGPEFPATVADDHLEVMLEKAGRLDKDSSEPWFYNSAMDASGLGKVHGGDLFWSKEFERSERVAPTLSAQDSAHWVQNKSVRFIKDVSDSPGAVFEKIPSKQDPKAFALKTVFGTYLSRDYLGRIVAVEPSACGGCWWILQTHPNLPEEGQCLTLSGVTDMCVGIRSPFADLATVYPSATKRSTMLRVTEDGEHITFESTPWGVVTVDTPPTFGYPWRRRQELDYGYEIQQMMMAEIAETGGTSSLWMGWQGGLVSGVVLGGFLVLIVYNLHFFCNSLGSAAPVRLPYFDVSRFALETLVVHTHLGVIGCSYNGLSSWMAAFRMPAFMFITGVFGYGMAYESFARVFCATLGSIVLMYSIRLLETAVVDGPAQVVNLVTPYPDLSTVGDMWFLAALCFCRFFVSPIFYAVRKLCLRPVVALVVVKTISFFLMAWSGGWTVPVFGGYNWTNSLAFAPYFGLGLLYSPKEWDGIFRRRAVQLASITYVALWYLLTLVRPFLVYNRMYCLPGKQPSGCISHFDPMQMDPGPITIYRYLNDWVLYLLRAGLTVSVVGTLFTLVLLVQPRAPLAIDYMAGWGSRTLYTYVMHLHLFNVLSKFGNFTVIFAKSMSRPAHLVCSLVLPLLINITFASRGTESLLKWLLMPFWMKDFFESYLCVVPKPAAKPQPPEAPPQAPHEKKERQDLLEIERHLAGDPKIAAAAVSAAAAAALYSEPPRGEEKAEFDGQPHKI